MGEHSISYKIVSRISEIFIILLLVTPVYVFKDNIGAYISDSLSLVNTENAYFSTLSKIFPQNKQQIYATDVVPVMEEQQSSQDKVNAMQYFSVSEHSARLIINSVGIDGPIVGGTVESTMKKGFWHYPTSSASFKYGNTTLIGHRYYKMPPHKDTFFNLDKVSVGDDVKITTDSGDLFYVVTEKKIINVSDTWILKSSDDPILTLITCHPLWTSKQRLVIISRLMRSTINL